VLARPKSRGNITLEDSDPSKPPLIDINLFSNGQDVKTLKHACYFILKLAKTKAMQATFSDYFQNMLPGCDRYQRKSLDFCNCYIKLLTLIKSDGCCTAKMGSDSDTMAVVNPELKVKGVKGLRIIDESIIPTIVSGSLTSTIMMIAEKGADIINGKILSEPSWPKEDLLPNPPIPVIQGDYIVSVWPQFQLTSKSKSKSKK